ncbi:MAG: nuclear transport factor 2 family protein [Xanthomonadaceae bacterium]|jgi:ketosteroid isomerase-like protein|nr:nuclear transport factor 2 family protein [Xanthomonadaceae bacterium]
MLAARALLSMLLLATASVSADDAADIRAFTSTYDRAYRTGDAKAIDALLAADYRTVVEGAVKDRATALTEFAAMDHDAISAMASTIDRVHVEGDLAVAVGRIDWTKGAEHGGEHFTLVLRREAGRWKAVDEHVSDVAKETTH